MLNANLFSKVQQIMFVSNIVNKVINNTNTDNNNTLFNPIMKQIAMTLNENNSSSDLNISKIISSLEEIKYEDKNLTISPTVKIFIKDYASELNTKSKEINNTKLLAKLQNGFNKFANDAKNKIENNTTNELLTIINNISNKTSHEIINPSNINQAPSISGTPTLTINENLIYTFIPNALDLDNDNLVFSIQNKPSWADFNTSTGKLKVHITIEKLQMQLIMI